MKFTYLLALLCFSLTSFATTNKDLKFQSKAHKRSIHKATELEIINQKYNKFQNQIQVPTIVKNYGWSDSLMNWEGESREEFTYVNDRIKSVITFDINRIDTISRLTLTYNADNYLLFYYLEVKSETGEFIPQTRIYYEYENNYQKMTVTSEVFASFLNLWIPNTKFSDEKINNGETSRTTNYIYFGGTWSVGSGYSYTIKKLNNNSSKVSEYIDSVLNTNLGEYEFYYKESRVYDANENAIAIVYTENVNGTNKITEIDSIYYVNNVPSEFVIAIANVGAPRKAYKYGNMVWQNYNSNKDINENRLTDYVGYAYTGSSWRFNDRTTTTFTDNFGSNVALNEEYIANTWTSTERYTQQFNRKAYLIFDRIEKYNANQSKWDTTNGNRSIVVYDVNDNIAEVAQSIYNPFLLAWENIEKQEYLNYITITTGINSQTKTIQTKLYPNPSADGKVSVNVKMEAASELSIKITDLKGSVVYNDVRNLGKGLNTVELSGLQQGMYLIVLSSEYGVSRSKLVVN